MKTTDPYQNAKDHSLWPDDIINIHNCLKVLQSLPYPLHGELDYIDSDGEHTAKLWFDGETEVWLVDTGSWK